MGEHNCYGQDALDCIRVKAYELWEKDGRRNGNDIYYWLEAENTVKPHINHKDRHSHEKTAGQ